jgi:hypothetical protein
MPAQSRSQKRLFQMVMAEKKHKFHTNNKELHSKVRGIAMDMTAEQASHYSRTSEKGLPEKSASLFDKLAARTDFAIKYLKKINKDSSSFQSKASPEFKLKVNNEANQLQADRVTHGKRRAIWRSRIPGWGQSTAKVLREARQVDKKASFMLGFLKAAEAYDIKDQQLADLVRYAGMDKEAFLAPLIAGGIRLAAPLAGMVGLPHLMEMGAARAAAGMAGTAGAKTLPGFMRGGRIESTLAGFADKAPETIQAGTPITRAPSIKKQVAGGLLGFAGMPLGSAIGEPFARHFDQQQQNSLPQEPQPQYNDEQQIQYGQ